LNWKSLSSSKKKGRNISPEEADEYIAGFMIMNDWSARALQMQEMQLNLGPAKGKDFSTSFGPYLVTPDELAEYQVPPPEGHVGTCYRLEMKAVVNGEEVSKGWLNEMHWTFAEIISRASYGVDLYPGDVIGSGTVGTGCFLELNGTGKFLNPEGFVEQWLHPGDQISLSVTGLGELKNEIIVAES
jgi:fumarylacetoacetate (FAA) hydrolase